ncbi:MAG: GNAT family N-acetyltransferase [Clostridia bacterium]|nr:GNAT family N-acetyltransferase [Clostridia bacterium]
MFIDGGLLHWATPLPVDFIRRECLEKEVYLVKSKASGKPVATFNFTGHPSMYFDLNKKALYMQRLAVTPEYWNKGIGTQCFEYILAQAKKRGCECVRSSVYEASDQAVTFLKRRGYRELYKRPSKHFVVLCMEREVQ